MKKLLNNTQKRNYYISYTIITILILFTVFLPFIINHKTLLGEGDALYQHVPFLDRIKDFYLYNIKAIFTGKELQQIDFNTFMGLDIIQTYNYYGYGNPLYILSIFFNKESMTYAHALIFFLSIYLGGIAFSEFCFYKNKSPKYVIIGAIIYILSPLAVLSFVPLCFVGLCYQIPLLFLGFDKILNNSKGKIFCFAIFLMALSGFYYLYMATIFIALYGVIIVFRQNKCNFKKSILDGLSKIFRTALLYLIGLGLAAPFFIPSLYGFFYCARVNHQVNNYQNTFFSGLKYILLYVPEEYVTLNIGVIIILVKLYTVKKHHLIKVLTALFILSTQVSFIGYVFNGFSKSSDRYFLFFFFYIAYITVIVLTELKPKPYKSFSIIISIACLVQPIIMSCLYSGADLCINQATVNELFKDELSPKIKKQSLPTRIEYLDYYQLDNTKKYSYSNSKNVTSPWLYSSTVPEALYNGMIAYDNCNFIDLNTIYGLNERIELHSLFNIQYLYNYKNNVTALPDFYKKLSNNLYENTYSVPFGYCYDKLVQPKSIDSLLPIEKSFLALEYGIVDDNYKGSNSIQKQYDLSTTINKIKINTIEQPDDYKYIISFNKLKNCQIIAQLNDSQNTGLNIQYRINDNIIKQTKTVSTTRGYAIPRNTIYTNIGYYNNIDTITIASNKPFPREDIKLYYIDLSTYKNTIDKLSKYHLENVTCSTNTIRGNISIPNNMLMCISIPNIPGWEAYIDNKKTYITTANYSFIGLDIPKGEHSITLKYHTPLLKQSIVLFFISILIFLYLYYCENIKCKNN